MGSMGETLIASATRYAGNIPVYTSHCFWTESSEMRVDCRGKTGLRGLILHTF